MKKFMQKKLNDKGLTLVELLAVIVILGIIAAIAIPAIGNIIENSRVSAIKGDAQNALAAASMYFTENPEKDKVTGAELVEADFMDDAGSAGALEVKYVKGGNTINGSATAKKTTVTFKDVTKKDITESGKATEVSPATGTTPTTE